MKTQPIKTFAILASSSLLLFSPTSQAITIDAGASLTLPNLLIDIGFSGSMTMYDPHGEPLQLSPEQSLPGDLTKHPVEGSMTLDAFTFGGTVEMFGPEPFFFSTWTADGDMSARVDPLGRLGLFGTPACAGYLMCATANMDFHYYNTVTPIMATFGMTPTFDFGLAWNPYKLRAGMSFEVNSIDTDGDGTLGTPITQNAFKYFTPAFEGVATIQRVYFGEGIPNPGLTPTSTPTTNNVPVPAALWLFGSGLVCLAGIARRRSGTCT